MSDTLDMLFFGDLDPHNQETVNAVDEAAVVEEVIENPFAEEATAENE